MFRGRVFSVDAGRPERESCHRRGMLAPRDFVEPDASWSFVTAADRAALMRKGVVVVGDGRSRQGRYVFVAGPDRDRTRVDARLHFGPKVAIDVVGPVPRHLAPRACDGFMEREEGRLQLRYTVSRSEHMDDINVEEDEEFVVVFATVCTPVVHLERELMECPHHVYLDRPLGGRTVFDAVAGREIPYRNVYDELRASGYLGDGDGRYRLPVDDHDGDWAPELLDPSGADDHDDRDDAA